MRVTGGPDPRSRRPGVPAKPVGFVGWGTREGAYSQYATERAQEATPEMGRMGPSDPDGLFGRTPASGRRHRVRGKPRPYGVSGRNKRHLQDQGPPVRPVPLEYQPAARALAL